MVTHDCFFFPPININITFSSYVMSMISLGTSVLEAVSKFQCAGILLLVAISLSVPAIEEIYYALLFNRALGVL